jgi:hypothetical protein
MNNIVNEIEDMGYETMKMLNEQRDKISESNKKIESIDNNISQRKNIKSTLT